MLPKSGLGSYTLRKKPEPELPDLKGSTVQIPQDSAALDGPQDEMGKPLDCRMGGWNMGKGVWLLCRGCAT